MVKLRRAAASTLLLGLVGSLLGFAYFSRFPESPVLERAESWPLVGPLAERFRAAYLRPAGESVPVGDPTEPQIIYVDQNGEPITGPLNLTGGPIGKLPEASPSKTGTADEEQR